MGTPLNTEVPVLGKTPNEMLDFSDDLLRVAEDILSEPDLPVLRDAVAGLKSYVESRELPNTTAAEFAEIFSDLDLAFGALQTYRLSFELSDNGVKTTKSTGAIKTSATANSVQNELRNAIGLFNLPDGSRVQAVESVTGVHSFPERLSD